MQNITSESSESFRWLFAGDPSPGDDALFIRSVYDGVGEHSRLMIFKSYDQGNSTVYLMVIAPLNHQEDYDKSDETSRNFYRNDVNDAPETDYLPEIDTTNDRFSWCFVTGNWEFNDIIKFSKKIQASRKSSNDEISNKNASGVKKPRAKRNNQDNCFVTTRLEMVKSKNLDSEDSEDLENLELHVKFSQQMPLAFSTFSSKDFISDFRGSSARWVTRFNSDIEFWDCIDLLSAVPPDTNDWSRLRSPYWIDECMETAEMASLFAEFTHSVTTDDRLLAVAEIAEIMTKPGGWNGRIHTDFFALKSDVYLNVPYSMKEFAKANGARWDPAAKSWYLPAGGNLTGVICWMKPENMHLISPIKSLNSSLSLN